MKRLIYSIFICTALLSCREENANSLKDSQGITAKIEFNKDLNVVKFSGKFSDVKNFVKSSETSREAKFLKLYDEGFIAHDFFDSPKVERLLSEKLSAKTKGVISAKMAEQEVSDEEFISNEDFREVLNDKYQVQVNDSIYQYTPNGLLISDVDHEEELEEYIDRHPDLTLPEGDSQINTNIHAFVPIRQEFDGYSVTTPTTTAQGQGLNQIPNLDDCTPRQPLIDQIFGKTYTCEHKFTSDRKLNTIFAVENYKLFFDVYAESKFKMKTWLGWFSSRDASKVVLNVKEASIGLERKNHEIGISGNDIQKNYQAILNVLKDKTGGNVAAITSTYDKFDSQNGLYQTYTVGTGINNSYEPNGVYIPLLKETVLGVRIDVDNIFGPNVKKVVFVTVFNKEHAVLTNEQILKYAYNAYKKAINYQDPPNSPVAIALQVLEEENGQLKSSLQNTVILNEYMEASGLAIVRKDFNIKKNFTLDGFTMNYSSSFNDMSNSTIGAIVQAIKFVFTAQSNSIKNYSVNLESAALYNGVWGGSKFKVVKN